MRLPHFEIAPEGATPIQKRNFTNVVIDGAGVAIASAAAPYLPVFLARLGATNLQVGLLTAMPAVTGLFFAILIGRFIQTRRKVVPWFSGARAVVLSTYAATGILPFFLPYDQLVTATLVLWALVTLPQIIVNVCFSVVMNGVAGPKGRYELMSRRWSVIGITAAVTIALAGQILDRIVFPLNYQIVFIGLSLGAFVSFYFSSRIELPDQEPPPLAVGQSVRERARGFIELIRGQPAFTSFMFKRFIFFSGTALATPIFPLYFVREVHASDAWIGIINTAQNAILLIGYLWWTRQSKQRGGRFVLLWTTFGLTLYPAFTAFTTDVQWIAIYAGIAGVFQAGLDLVFFDELLKTFPAKYSATFVSIAQSLQHMSTIAAPLVGTMLADHIGLSGALLVSASIRLIAFGLFLRGK
jgi:MFS family permease